MESGPTKSEQAKKQGFRLKKLKLRRIKTWVLLLVLAGLLFIDATLLRLNHIKMTELRDAVLAADASEDDEATLAALNELRDFTFSHIVINVVEENGVRRVTFGTGPFYLEHQYIRVANRALEEAEAVLADDANPNGNIYKEASDVCSARAIQNGWSWDTPEYINCMVSEIQKYPAASELNDQVRASLPSTELFRYNYASPLWESTGVGVCLLLTLLLIVVIFIRAVVWIFLRLSLLFL